MKTTLALRAALLLFTVLFIASCKDDDEGACGLPENTEVRIIETGGASLTYIPYSGTLTNNGENTVFYSYSGNLITFFVGMNVPGICTENHLHPSFRVSTWEGAVNQTAKIYFEAYWNILFPGEDFVAVDGLMQPNHNYTGSLECGLKQVFQDNPANVDLYANVQFEGSGDFNLDRGVFEEMINKLEISCTYDQDI